MKLQHNHIIQSKDKFDTKLDRYKLPPFKRYWYEEFDKGWVADGEFYRQW